jgi:hypothetical protein
MTSARASSAVGTILARFSILTWAVVLSQLFFIPCVVDDTASFYMERMHLNLTFIFPSHMTCTANVKVFTQQLFTSITMHVNIGKLF